MISTPTPPSEADAVRPKTEAGLRPGGGAALVPGGVFMTFRRPATPHLLPSPAAIVARQTAITVPAPLGAGQHERLMQ